MDIGPVAQIILPSLELSDEDSFNLRVSIQKNNKVDNDNNTYRLKLSYFLKLLFLLRTEIEMEYRYSESGYLNYFYGNSYQKSLKNGLREFMTNGSSSESLSISQNLILSFSENYGVFFRWQVDKFSSTPKKSPYVADLGSGKSSFYGISLFYRWD